MLSVRHLSKSFGGVAAMSDVTLDFPANTTKQRAWFRQLLDVPARTSYPARSGNNNPYISRALGVIFPGSGQCT